MDAINDEVRQGTPSQKSTGSVGAWSRAVQEIRAYVLCFYMLFVLVCVFIRTVCSVKCLW